MSTLTSTDRVSGRDLDGDEWTIFLAHEGLPYVAMIDLECAPEWSGVGLQKVDAIRAGLFLLKAAGVDLVGAARALSDADRRVCEASGKGAYDLAKERQRNARKALDAELATILTHTGETP